MSATLEKLGNLITVVMGQAPPSEACNKNGEGTIFVKAGEFGISSPIVAEWTTKPLKLAEEGDSLICVVGATAGKVNRSTFKCSIGRSVAAVRSNKKILDQDYLHSFLKTKVDQLRDRSQGAAQGVITKEMLHDLSIPLPPLAEQQRIAALLDTADNLLRLREAAIEKLDQLIRSVFIEMFGSVRENTKNWPLKSFAELAINEDYKRRPIKSSDRENRNGEYAYYGASGIIDSIDDYIFEGESLLIGEDGANLLARSSPIAFMANGKYWVNNHAHILREHESASLRYLEFFVDQIDLSPYITGSAQPKLTRANLDRILVPLPPRSLQNRFAEIVKNIERQREAAIIHCEKALGLSKTLQYQSFAVN
jgi:type I restriction enzyme S subunit